MRNNSPDPSPIIENHLVPWLLVEDDQLGAVRETTWSAPSPAGILVRTVIQNGPACLVEVVLADPRNSDVREIYLSEVAATASGEIDIPARNRALTVADIAAGAATSCFNPAPTQFAAPGEPKPI